MIVKTANKQLHNGHNTLVVSPKCIIDDKGELRFNVETPHFIIANVRKLSETYMLFSDIQDGQIDGRSCKDIYNEILQTDPHFTRASTCAVIECEVVCR